MSSTPTPSDLPGVEVPGLGRSRLVDDRSLSGAAFCRAYSDRVDEWLVELFEGPAGWPGGVALVAVGGYGRAELSPQSDLDLLLCHDGTRDDTAIGEIAERIWYPIWDEGLKLGHAVRTVKEAVDLAASDLDTATSLLSVRVVAGNAALGAELAQRAQALWRKRSKRFLAELSDRVRARHAKAGEVAFLLEPDLKEGRGGLRDVHAVGWAEASDRVLLEEDDDCLGTSAELLLATRVELHRVTGRPGDTLLLQEQDAVAARLGYGDADALMAAVAAAARCIAWISDETWDRIDSSLRGPRVSIHRRDKPAGTGVVLREGRAQLTAEADPAADPLLVLRAAVAAAEGGTRIERASLRRLVGSSPLPEPWPAEARQLLARLLLAGSAAIPVIESLDQKGLWARLIPEWAPVRSRPQRNAYHRFTVDRHLVEAAVEAAALADRVDRPDLLVVGTLLHDLGKGHPGDHTEVGVELIATVATRMGFPPDDVAVLTDLCRHHLLLPDVATRRDLADAATIRHVAEQVGDLSRLRLLAALTEADSRATGPAAWGPWKAELVAELVERTARWLGEVPPGEQAPEEFPTVAQRALLARGEVVVETSDDTLTVVVADRPGMFARVAGVLALNGLEIRSAAAYSEDGMALEVLRVESPRGSVIGWDRVRSDLDRVLTGRLALASRLAQRASTYGSRRPSPLVRSVQPQVRFDNEMASAATVVEVHAPDSIGLLYRITRALAELDLDIRSAKVQTLGAAVVDAFYVVGPDGGPVVDPADLVEIERAVLHAISEGGPGE